MKITHLKKVNKIIYNAMLNDANSEKESLKVQFLKRHSRFAYVEGDITVLSKQNIALLTEDPDDPYIKILPMNWKPEEVKKKEKPELSVRVRFLKPSPLFSYSEGDITLITREHAIKLLEDIESPCIEILPDDWQAPVEKASIPEEMVDVTWIKPHFKYAYNAGDKGKVKSSDLSMLTEGGFVEPKKVQTYTQSWLSRMLKR